MVGRGKALISMWCPPEVGILRGLMEKVKLYLGIGANGELVYRVIRHSWISSFITDLSRNLIESRELTARFLFFSFFIFQWFFFSFLFFLKLQDRTMIGCEEVESEDSIRHCDDSMILLNILNHRQSIEIRIRAIWTIKLTNSFLRLIILILISLEKQFLE